MLTLGPLAFSAPWLLLGLGALPILWLLLRAVPPAPIRRRFPAVALLLGLRDDESLTERTPWWLLLLRLLAVAALIAGFAGGLSTFSAYVGQTVNYWRKGRLVQGVLNTVLQFGLPSTAVYLVALYCAPLIN